VNEVKGKKGRSNPQRSLGEQKRYEQNRHNKKKRDKQKQRPVHWKGREKRSKSHSRLAGSRKGKNRGRKGVSTTWERKKKCPRPRRKKKSGWRGGFGRGGKGADNSRPPAKGKSRLCKRSCFSARKKNGKFHPDPVCFFWGKEKGGSFQGRDST